MTENRLMADGLVDVSVGADSPEENAVMPGTVKLPDRLPILPVKDMSMFPRMVLPMLVSDQKHQNLVNDVLSGERLIGLVAIKGERPSSSVSALEHIHEVGVAALVLKMNQVDDQDAVRLVAQGLSRFRIIALEQVEPYLVARIEPLADIVPQRHGDIGPVQQPAGLFKRMLDLAPHMPEELQGLAVSIDDPGSLCDLVTSTLKIGPEERQSVVEAIDVRERLRRVTTLVNHEIQVLELGSKIQSQVKEGLDKTQREYYLRQQLKAIKAELGEGEEAGDSEVEILREKLAQAKLPEEAQAEADRELGRLAKMHPSSSEYHVITTYLDWMINLHCSIGTR